MSAGRPHPARRGPVGGVRGWLRRLPFRVRLMLSFAAVMVVLFGGLALLLDAELTSSLDQGINRSLRARAAELATLVRGRAPLPALPEVDGAFAQILDPRTGRVLDATVGFRAPLLGGAQLRRAARTTLMVDRGDRSRLLAAPIATDPPAVLVVGSSLAQRDHALTSLSELLFIGGPLLLLITCLAGYVLAERALAPVQRMSEWAERISGSPHDERLPVPEARDELHRLGETLNAMLDRLEDALRRERTFVACAGHELRTPLSILKLELELARAAAGRADELERRLSSAGEEVDRLAALARDLLVVGRAELGQLELHRRPVGVGELLAAVAARFDTATRRRRSALRIEVRDEETLDADPERLEQALANLVANALRHGAGQVVLRAQRAGEAVELHVLDEGDGFAADFLPRAFECFTRADPSRPGGGVGLGLSIVEAIAEAHGGSAHAANRPGGGADVWISLPRAPAPAAGPRAGERLAAPA
ncbi:MAG TPA: ATP-binding protein [Solirubrobacteraceae bacterium]|nr:ATP-binding protein [Solirubrobacteraceae bacterium]